jgi:Xaa-Pro aminopeptidase
MNYAERLARLGARLGDFGVDALLVTNLTNVRYLTGYTGSNGAVVVRQGDAVFLTDFRYLQRVEPLREFVEVRQAKQDLIRFVSTRWEELAPGAGRIGFESAHVTVAAHATLAEAAGSIELVPTIHVVEDQRMVKDAGEVAAIRRAAEILTPVYETLLDDGLAGRTEFDVAWRVHELVRRHGGDDLSFDPIIASGEAGALPHAEPRREPIAEGVLVTIDIGAKLDGYCSDCTRTFATGPISDELHEIYELVARAQLAGLEAVRPGVAGGDVDAMVRELVADAGHGEHFQHGLGHGVGLDIHEDPRLAAASTATLEPGMIVTVEPGVYVPGLGGVRIEDLVVVTEEGCERLTGYPKELIGAGQQLRVPRLHQEHG